MCEDAETLEDKKVLEARYLESISVAVNSKLKNLGIRDVKFDEKMEAPER